MIKPSIFAYDTCAQFQKEFSMGEGDLVITNQFIYDPYFGKMDIKADVLYQEKYGAGEPSDDMVEAMCKDIKGSHKRIIAIGGGTVIDIAKVFALKQTSPLLGLYDKSFEIVKDKELVLVPTTCGTGSEVTNVAVFALNARNTKMGLAMDEMYADSAVLIPELLGGLPFQFFATSSIDALIHAIESYVSPLATPYTEMYSLKAIEMLLKGYKIIAKDGPDARVPLLGDFLIASNYAGIAFGNAGCGAVHAMAYPLGGKYHVAHGESNYCCFTGVFKHYMKLKPVGKIEKLNAFLADLLGCKAETVYEDIEKLLDIILPKKPMREYGVTEVDVEEFASAVITGQQRLLGKAYTPLAEEDVLEIYRSIY